MDEENEWKRWMEEVEAVKLEVRKISEDEGRKALKTLQRSF